MGRLIFPISQADCIGGCAVVHVLQRVLKNPSEIRISRNLTREDGWERKEINCTHTYDKS